MANELTTSDDVEALLLRSLTADERSFMPRLIEMAASKLRTQLPGIDDRIALFETDPTNSRAINPDTASSVLAGAIKRYMVNLEGATSKSEARTDGPFSVSQTTSFASYGKAIMAGVAGELTITAGDIKELTQAPSGLPRSIRTTPALAPGRLERSVRRDELSIRRFGYVAPPC